MNHLCGIFQIPVTVLAIFLIGLTKLLKDIHARKDGKSITTTCTSSQACCGDVAGCKVWRSDSGGG